MKRKEFIIVLLSSLFLFPSFAQSQPDKGFERSSGAGRHSGDLRVLQLEMNPDPVRGRPMGEFPGCRLEPSPVIPARVSLFIKDRDEVVTAVHDVSLKPGNNRIVFPQTHYRFPDRNIASR